MVKDLKDQLRDIEALITELGDFQEDHLEEALDLAQQVQDRLDAKAAQAAEPTPEPKASPQHTALPETSNLSAAEQEQLRALLQKMNQNQPSASASGLPETASAQSWLAHQ